MPYKPNIMESANCPYCYDGSIVYDPHSKRCHCTHCNNIVLMEGLYEVNP